MDSSEENRIADTILSIRNKIKITIDGFVYKKSKNRKDIYYWVCEKSGKKGNACGCKGTAKTVYRNEKHIIHDHDVSKHNHAPEASRPQIIKRCMKIKELAKASNEKPCTIIRDVTVNTEKSIQPYLPNKNALTQQILHTRKINKPKEPRNIDELNLSDEMSKTLDGKPFVKIIKERSEAIILFTTTENLKILAEVKCWIMDGTFKAIPTFFKQLYTIHGCIGEPDNSKTVPLVYALLTSKRQTIYELLLNKIISLADEINVVLRPEFILTDFEIAAINAIKLLFPFTKIKGCFFHLCQNIYRKIQKNGLTKKYGSDERFSLFVRQIPCLAFLEPREISDTFEELKCSFPPEGEHILQWFDKYYVHGIVRQRSRRYINSITIRSPLFPPDMWSVYDNNLNGFPRTQNSVESWHRRWQCLIDRHNIGIFKLITEIQKEQAIIENTIQKLFQGEPPEKRKRKDKLKEERMQRIIHNRHTYTALDFIRAIAYSISM